MINLTTKYALQVLEVLAKRRGDKFIKIEKLGEDSDVPTAYLAKIMKKLASNNIVESRRGLSGGVRFPANRSPISFYEIAFLLDDPIVSQSCFLNKTECSQTATCRYHSDWGKIITSLIRFLKNTYITPTQSSKSSEKLYVISSKGKKAKK